MEKEKKEAKVFDFELVEKMLSTSISVEEFAKNRDNVEKSLKEQYGDGTGQNTGEATFYF